jgi:hypothetical protein
METRPFLLLAALIAVEPALAEVPLPRPRPPEIREAKRIPVDPAAAEAEGKACDALFAENIVIAERAAGMAFDNGCGAPAPVKLTAVRLSGDKLVQLSPAALLRCEAALAVARWVRDDLAPATAALGSALVRVEVAASYVCRPRNNVTGAVLSEHGRANALDVRAIALADKRTIEMTAGPPEFLAAVKRSACARFTTVLGPGADPSHEFHLHVDLAARRGGYRICQWTLPTGP